MFKIIVVVTILMSNGPPQRDSLISNAGFPSMQLCEAQIEKDRPGLVADITEHYGKQGVSADRITVDMQCQFQSAQ